MHPLRARLAHGAEVEALEQPELLEEDRRLAPRAGLEDLVAVVVDGERLLPGRGPAAQVLLREQARVALAAAVEPLALLEADDLLRDEAAVPAVVRRLELCVPVRGRRLSLREDAVVRLGENAVPVQRPRLGSRQVDVHARRPVLGEELLDPADRVADRREGRIAVLGVADREMEDVAERHRPVLAQQRDPAAEGAGHDRGQRAGAGNQREPELVAIALDRRSRVARAPARRGRAAGRARPARRAPAGRRLGR